MKKSSIGVLAAIAALVATGAPSAKPTAKPLAVHQESTAAGNLLVPGDRVELGYDAPGVKSLTGSLFVRNDLQGGFEHLRLKPMKGRATGLRAVVPSRLIRGHKLFYYAVVRDPRTGRSAQVPAAGPSGPQVAWILQKPVIVRLGTHQFDHTRTPDAVVARIDADKVGWQLEGDRFGPQTFVVGRDRSVWLDDSLNNRLLAWLPGRPDSFMRSVALPDRSADRDVALGPAGSVYVTGAIGHGASYKPVLYRLSATGRVLWRIVLAGELRDSGSFLVGANSPLRVGPDGTLYCLVGMPALVGGERGWMPVATPGGRPLSIAAQRRGTHWPYQPVAGGLRLLSEVYAAIPASAPHEARYALLDRRGRVVRSWRVLSRTSINFDYATPELVGGDPVVVLDATAQMKGTFKWEYVVLRLGPHGTRTQFSLPRAVYGDNVLADVRVGPDGNLYQLGSSPATGVEITRYSLGPLQTTSTQRRDS